MHAVHVSRSAFRGWLFGMVTGGALVLAGSLGLGLPNRPAAVEPPSVPITAGSTSSGAGLWETVVESDERPPRRSNTAGATQTSTSLVESDERPPRRSKTAGATQPSSSLPGNPGLDPQATQRCDTPAFSSGPGERDLFASGSLLFETCRMVGPGEGTNSAK
jgi:hypothetical protein